MPFGARGVRPGCHLQRTVRPENESPMPFGARGVRPNMSVGQHTTENIQVSNAFRREGRSPRHHRCRRRRSGPRKSPMPFGARGVRPPTKSPGSIHFSSSLQCLSARGAFAPLHHPASLECGGWGLQCLSARGAFAPTVRGLFFTHKPGVSNAFRREGRSPQDNWRCARGCRGLSPMPFGARGVRPANYTH